MKILKLILVCFCFVVSSNVYANDNSMGNVKSYFENKGFSFSPAGKDKKAILAKSGAGALIIAPDNQDNVKAMLYVLDTNSKDAEMQKSSAEVLDVFLSWADDKQQVLNWVVNCIALIGVDKDVSIDGANYKCSAVKHNIMFMKKN